MVQSRAPTTIPSDGIANRLLLSLPKTSLERLRPALESRSMGCGVLLAYPVGRLPLVTVPLHHKHADGPGESRSPGHPLASGFAWH